MMRLALIGRGRWGQNIERTLRSLGDIELVVVERGTEPPADIEGVLIATPSSTHARLALPFIESGIPTFIEKPMTTSVADALRLQEAALARGTLVHVGHIYLHNPAFHALRDALPRIGRIHSVVSEKMNYGPRSDSSVYWDWLPHDLSMAITLFGPPRAVRALTTVRSDDGQAHAGVVATEFAFGHVISNVSSVSHDKRKRFSVFGDAGTLVFDDAAEDKVALVLPDGARETIACGREAPLAEELSVFIDAIRSGATAVEEIDFAVQVVGAVEAAEESAYQEGMRLSILAL